MESTSNYKKYTRQNPLQQWLIGRFTQTLIALVRQANPSTVLDVGCGEGFILARLEQERIAQHLEGIEISETSLKIAKEIHPSLSIGPGDVYHLSYDDSSFDLVLCSEVLEHLDNPSLALANIKRVSKKYCLFSVPHEPFFMLANFLRGKNLSRFGNDPEHIQHWTSVGFGNFLTKNGFTVVKKISSFPWTLVLAKK